MTCVKRAQAQTRHFQNSNTFRLAAWFFLTTAECVRLRVSVSTQSPLSGELFSSSFPRCAPASSSAVKRLACATRNMLSVLLTTLFRCSNDETRAFDAFGPLSMTRIERQIFYGMTAFAFVAVILAFY